MIKRVKIKISNFSSSIDNQRSGFREIILSNIKLLIYSNSINTLVGLSGIGKSSLYKSIFRIFPFNSKGENDFYDDYSRKYVSLNLLKTEEIYENIIGKKVIILDQNPFACLNPYLRIIEQFIYLLKEHKTQNEIIEQSIKIMYELNLKKPKEILWSLPNELSGGMLQRVILAMSLLKEPEVIIGDEFLSALDIDTKNIILNFLKDKIKKTSLTVVWITHDIYSCLKYSHFINIINRHRKITFSGSTNVFKSIVFKKQNLINFFY